MIALPSLTFFCCPKPFEGKFAAIQENAIRSWSFLNPRPEIILIGDELGVAEFAKKWGFSHVAHVERNAYGTPMVKSLFDAARSNTSSALLCYINADIILFNDFMIAFQKVCRYVSGRHFLMCGRRWNLRIDGKILWDATGIDRSILDRLRTEGWLDSAKSLDYFVFSRDLFLDMPPFVIGRFGWDAWPVYSAMRSGAYFFDVSCDVRAIHQMHDYGLGGVVADHVRQVRDMEHAENRRIGRAASFYTLFDATHVLCDGIVQAPGFRRFFLSRAYRWSLYLQQRSPWLGGWARKGMLALNRFFKARGKAHA